ncbi:thioredoxin family protein [Robiginitalea sediminis]|uniref:thioredoxin family protein n=1 Tax=Robiginitalea sediminis TaxID=1982593 RepID=UPI000B4B29D3|nr:thioredoxin family protein [Robiginitalea sediminis]
MHKTLLAAGCGIVLVLFANCKAQPYHTAERMPDREETEILVGTANFDSLRTAPFGNWFQASVKSYEPNIEKAEQLEELLRGVRITTFMGTWCKDSKREVPRFVKILETADYPVEEVEVIAMTRDKTTPQQYEAGMDIINVPTFIFYKDGQELGRIVEFPIEDLETDMVKILSGQPYKHAYDWD